MLEIKTGEYLQWSWHPHGIFQMAIFVCKVLTATVWSKLHINFWSLVLSISQLKIIELQRKCHRSNVTLILSNTIMTWIKCSLNSSIPTRMGIHRCSSSSCPSHRLPRLPESCPFWRYQSGTLWSNRTELDWTNTIPGWEAKMTGSLRNEFKGTWELLLLPDNA